MPRSGENDHPAQISHSVEYFAIPVVWFVERMKNVRIIFFLTVVMVAGQFCLSAAGMLGDQKYIFDRARSHWAFQPIKQPRIPPTTKRDWLRNDLDTFILQEIESQGLRPAPEAEPATLVRRLYFDLIGLPPTYDQVQAWTNNWSDKKYSELVEHLLASKHYGERWGRHWLDVARYADTKGHMAGGEETRFPFAYTYRDWVVNALNDDLPYDEFIRRQLAADTLLEQKKATTSDLAALGFVTVGSRFSGKDDLMLDDRIDVVTRGFLGLTVSCARCHDHKFDPIPTADYYSLYGVFDNSEEPKELPRLLAPTELSPEQRGFEKKLATMKGAVDAFISSKYLNLRKAGMISRYLQFAIDFEGATASQIVSEAGKRKVYHRVATRWQMGLKASARAKLPVFIPWHASASLFKQGKIAEAQAALRKSIESNEPAPNQLVVEALGKSFPKTLTELCDIYGHVLAESDSEQPHADKAREELRQILNHPAGPTGFPIEQMPGHWDRATRDEHRKMVARVDKFVVDSMHSPPRAMALRDRDKMRVSYVYHRGERGRRGDQVPRQFLAILDGDNRKPFSSGSGRLDLAEKIASADNPLTARVMVNRLWMHHFGQPLVSTPSDFGLQTPKPDHADLLDWLSREFIKNEWSLKALHRIMVTSAAYRQSSTADAGSRQRDPANRYWARAERQRLDYETTRDSMLTVGGELDRAMGGRPQPLEGKNPTRRRAIYGFIDRFDVPSMLRTFDFADPNLHASERPETTVPQQALFFLNSTFADARAAAIVKKTENMEPAARTRALYQTILSRNPTTDELAAANSFARSYQQEGWQNLAQALLASNEFSFID